MRLVLDASAAVEWALCTELGQRIQALFEREHPWLYGSEFLDLEVLQALRRQERRREMSKKVTEYRWTVYRLLPIQRVQLRPLLTSIGKLRHRFSSYDASYVMLARALEAPLLTTDEKLARSLPRGVRRQAL